jgi:hypothetical protein
MTFLRSVHCYNLVGALATPLSPQVPKLQQSMHISCYIALVHKSFESYKRLAQGQVTRYKHIKGPNLPNMVPAAQPRLMKHAQAFF